jgi:uncharacterized membrane protein
MAQTTPDSYSTTGRSWESTTHAYPASVRGTGSRVNVGIAERLVSALAGVLLLSLGLRRRGPRALLPIGGGLLFRGVTGWCPVNAVIGRNSALDRETEGPGASVGRGQGIKVERRVTIDRSPEECYAYWRDFRNLPQFMEHLEAVTVLDDRRSHWVAKAPAGTHVEWDAEVHNEIPGELVAWRSLPGADVNNAGSVHFTPTPEGRGTEVRVVLSYEPPAHTGRLGATIARLMGEEPSVQVDEDLRRFKQVMEAESARATQGRSARGR